MPLSGQAKIDYQREYMKKYRSNARSNVKPESVRPSKTQDVRPLEPDVILEQPNRVTVNLNRFPAGGHCQYCGVKLPLIATCCNTCARKEDG